MFKKVKWGAVTLASALLAGSLGLASPALAEDVPTGTPANAKLTKVINAPETINASADSYTFQFAGNGTVSETGEKLISGGVEQDGNTIKVGDSIPQISDLTLRGVNMNSAPSLTGGSFKQTVVQASMGYILGLKDANGNAYACDYSSEKRNEVVFPHAGMYTYRVTEARTSNAGSGSNIIPSRASYLLRVNVKNVAVDGSSTGETKPVVDTVTVEKERNDEGNTIDDASTGDGTGGTASKKVDPTKPDANYNPGNDGENDRGGKITNTDDGDNTEDDRKIEEGKSVGDSRGRDVNGFTFSNEYTKGGNFTIEKRVNGDSADKSASNKFEITLTINDAAAPDGSGYAYTITNGGEDVLNKQFDTFAIGEVGGGFKYEDEANSVVATKTGVKLAKFSGGVATIKANLAHGQQIKIEGLYGTERYKEDGNGNDSPTLEKYNGNPVRAFLAEGLKADTHYRIEEKGTPNYRAAAFIFNQGAVSDLTVDDKTTYDSMSDVKYNDTNPGHFRATPGDDLKAENTNTADEIKDTIAGTEGGLVYIVNAFDDTKASPTGIFIDNLPYVLMVGIPVAVFAGMFVNKRRHADDLAE